jgi:hypothetical protein
VKHLKRHLSAANVISCIALFVALSGATYAATTAAKNSVKAKSIARGAVTTPKLRNSAVTAAKIANGAVLGSKIAGGAVGSTQLLDGGIRSVDLGGQVVTTAKLKNGGVTEEKIANSAVTSFKLAADAVGTGKIQDGAVTAVKLAPSFNTQLVKNVSYVTKASSTDSVSPKTATAECPAGKVAIAGGAKLTLGSAIGVALGESAPTAPDAQGKRLGWTASAHEVVGAETESWSVEAYAVCAEA